MRLNRYLAACGYGSRRACESLILEGQVTINGEPCTDLATTVEENDEVHVGGKRARPPEDVYYVLHKPKGYITTAADTHERKTIFDLLPPNMQQLHYIGRLDQDSEGLLILTNDGELSHRLAHPSRGVEKEYEVTIEPSWDPKSAKRLLSGMLIEEKHAKFERIHQVSANRLRIVLHQGLKRQIRVMLLYVGYKVKSLVRVRIGQLTLDNLPRGSHRKLRPVEVKALKSLVGLAPAPNVSANTETRAPKPAKPATTGEDEASPAGRPVRRPATARPVQRPGTGARARTPANRGAQGGERPSGGGSRGPRAGARSRAGGRPGSGGGRSGRQGQRSSRGGRR